MGFLSNLVVNIYIFSYDILLSLFNLVTPKRRIGHVVLPGNPGEGGKWPEYIAPKEGDSRSPCPGLNAMANHGILPRDGKNITFVEMKQRVQQTYNFAPTFSHYVPNVMAGALNRSYAKDRLDLAEVSVHNAIEHDASLTREDAALAPDQGPPSIPLCQALLDSATGQDSDGKPCLTIADISRYLGKRRTDARQTNKDFSLTSQQKTFGSANASTLLAIFGGRVEDLRTFLLEERLPEGWESRVRSRHGLTFMHFNRTVFWVGLGIKEGEVDTKKPTVAPAPTAEAATVPAAAAATEVAEV